MAAKRTHKKSSPKPQRGGSPVPKAERQTVVSEGLSAASYEEMLISSIASGVSQGRSTEHSILFSSVLSTLTPGIRILHYKNGISVGRTLYRLCNQRKHYALYEESVRDLVDFLESAGFSKITYTVIPDRIEIKFNDRDNAYLGTNVHVFESGIMCGFLSEAKHQHVKVEEVSCSSNGSEYCQFITQAARSPYRKQNGDEVLDRFADAIKASLESKTAVDQNSFAEEYLMLALSASLRHGYAEHMNSIVNHLGRKIGSELNLGLRSGEQLERLYGMLDLGELAVKSVRPVSIQISFPSLKSKKEFVDISIAFLDGVLNNIVKGGARINTAFRNSNGSYVLLLNEIRR